ncbi:TRAP transporter permease [Paradesulfitobacterium ferrireducens]|uniref:TRAP transporter permease n=1 Tax=Paradesulfitobacterium ferrireducens TaxID=2816476 RepID=UPI001A9009EC|nr:TRAP transporter permease [Paradesulfitobacterium ferrireducens]
MSDGHKVNQESIQGNIGIREFEGNFKKLITVLAVALSLFQLYTAAFGIFKNSIVHRAVHLTFIMVLFFLLYPSNKNLAKSRIWLFIDAVIATLALISVGYIAVFYEQIAERIGNLQGLTQFDYVIGMIVIVLVLEATRRTNHIFLGLMILALVYMVYGPYFPGLFAHPGIGLERLIYLLTYSSEGIFGTGLAVSSTYLYLFILFGVFLGKTGVTDFFVNFALSLVGRFAGGSAKASVIGSSLMGTVSGSSIGNVVASGTFTIPMMKAAGFRNHVAGAVEAVASSGGQLMPPVMGSAAFIMAEITGVSYGKIALTALIPAIIYYVNIFAVIHFEAVQHGLKGLPKDEVPRLKHVLKTSGYLIIPVLVLIYMLMIRGYTATKAGFVAIIASILVTYLRKENHFSWRDFLHACEKGARSALEIAILCAGIGIIISAVVLTGLGMRFSSIAMSLTGGELIPVLFMGMIISIILGMGMPTPVVYMLMAMFTAPTMVQMGVPLLAAHLFVFYYAILSGLTPPVCIAAIVAAGIADANWLKTGLTSSRFALTAFIIPYMWVFGPQLLMVGTWYEVLIAFVLACIGTVAMAGAVQGWLIEKTSVIERLILAIAGLLMIKPGWVTDGIGLALLALVMAFQWKARKTETLAI